MLREKLLVARDVLATAELHNRSLMEMATTAKVLEIISPLRPFPRIVAAAARLGGSYDDVFDFGINRQVAAEGPNRDGNGCFQEDYSYYATYLQAFRAFLREVGQSSLRRDEMFRMAEASRVFVRNLAVVEFHALSLPESAWSTQRTIEYRAAVCLLWATFFGALGSERVQLKDFNLSEGINEPKNHYSRYLVEDSREAKWVQELYHGAVAYQLVCDWTGKRLNRCRFIPGLANLNQRNGPFRRQEYQKLLNESIAQAKSSGMDLSEEVFIRFVFPFLRLLTNLRAEGFQP